MAVENKREGSWWWMVLAAVGLELNSHHVSNSPFTRSSSQFVQSTPHNASYPLFYTTVPLLCMFHLSFDILQPNSLKIRETPSSNTIKTLKEILRIYHALKDYCSSPICRVATGVRKINDYQFLSPHYI